MTPEQQDLFERAQAAKQRVDKHVVQMHQLHDRQVGELRTLVTKHIEERRELDELLGRLAAQGLAL